MKILIINTLDTNGGAARAAYRLHKALLSQGVDSTMLVDSKLSDEYSVISYSSKIEKLIKRLGAFLDRVALGFYKNRSKILFSPSILGSNIVEKIDAIDPDIVHIHWINGGMVKIEDLAKIRRPIVWSLHDMWAFTGGCHYDEECGEFTKNCSNCQVLNDAKESNLSRWIHSRKERTYSKIDNLTIVGLSRWLMNSSQSSSLLKDRKHVNLPNPIDTAIFKPSQTDTCRRLWNLPRDKKLILFGAMSATSDPRKGFDILVESLSRLDSQDVEFVVVGATLPKTPPKLNLKGHYVGRLYDDISLATLYSAVDVMVVPSRQENLSNAIMESLACGTPVVAFDIGGNSDMIEHKKNGYLAKPFDTKELANGIEWTINHSDPNTISKNAIEKVAKEFDSKVVAREYMKLYEEIS